ncbi:MAG: hypothetical protein JJU34_17750 [Lunatimonas sp.]|uniref:hypothetical protein n=1 Tax=Lunatimonas sp. TaxID=2060141 RepID=UPI00263A7A78|nr:hypothetical protein [Lunatimonas sp.]MCC5939128.1 hypothetical protein [Lunatimonas sp.]
MKAIIRLLKISGVAMLGMFASVSFVGAQSLTDRLFLSVAIDPTSGGSASSFVKSPPVGIYLETGITEWASFGFAVGTNVREGFSMMNPADSKNWVSLGISARAMVYAFQTIEALGGSSINVLGLEPYAGLTYGRYWPSILLDVGTIFNYYDLGVVVGTRWYFSSDKKFGLMAEYSSVGNTGLGGGLNVGVTIGL